jgi:hypothetical protein
MSNLWPTDGGGNDDNNNNTVIYFNMLTQQLQESITESARDNMSVHNQILAKYLKMLLQILL